ncbi:helix-turn-helix transcriptional regulator [Pantoea allii]|uniref:helix-turn-helix transcriptional regulator n=1 Tax=Pantoea allii TaxID=574096 RepID=UPI003D31CB48
MEIKNNDGQKVCLTVDEISLTWFFMTGMDMKQIASWMALPVHAAYYIKQRVMKKLGVKNNSEFIIWFLNNRRRDETEKTEHRRLPHSDSLMK